MTHSPVRSYLMAILPMLTKMAKTLDLCHGGDFSLKNDNITENDVYIRHPDSFLRTMTDVRSEILHMITLSYDKVNVIRNAASNSMNDILHDMYKALDFHDQKVQTALVSIEMKRLEEQIHVCEESSKCMMEHTDKCSGLFKEVSARLDTKRNEKQSNATVVIADDILSQGTIIVKQMKLEWTEFKAFCCDMKKEINDSHSSLNASKIAIATLTEQDSNCSLDERNRFIKLKLNKYINGVYDKSKTFIQFYEQHIKNLVQEYEHLQIRVDNERPLNEQSIAEVEDFTRKCDAKQEEISGPHTGI